MEATTKEGRPTNDEVSPIVTGMNEHFRTWRDRRIGVNAMMRVKGDRKRHAQSMEVMKRMHNEMKWAYNINQESGTMERNAETKNRKQTEIGDLRKTDVVLVRGKRIK